MDKSVEFYYIKDSSNKEQNKIDILTYVRCGDKGYDYYLINLFLDNHSILYDISKITNIFSYAKKNKIKINKMNGNLNENLYKFLIKILWDYIYTNKYTIFDLKDVELSQFDINNELKGTDVYDNFNIDLKEVDLKKVK